MKKPGGGMLFSLMLGALFGAIAYPCLRFAEIAAEMEKSIALPLSVLAFAFFSLILYTYILFWTQKMERRRQEAIDALPVPPLYTAYGVLSPDGAARRRVQTYFLLFGDDRLTIVPAEGKKRAPQTLTRAEILDIRRRGGEALCFVAEDPEKTAERLAEIGWM